MRPNNMFDQLPIKRLRRPFKRPKGVPTYLSEGLFTHGIGLLIYFFFIALIIFISLSFALLHVAFELPGFIGVPPTPVPPLALGDPIRIDDSTVSTLKIETDIPPMEVEHQTLVSVAIYSLGAGARPLFKVKVVPNATSLVTDTTPVG